MSTKTPDAEGCRETTKRVKKHLLDLEAHFHSDSHAFRSEIVSLLRKIHNDIDGMENAPPK